MFGLDMSSTFLAVGTGIACGLVGFGMFLIMQADW